MAEYPRPSSLAFSFSFVFREVRTEGLSGIFSPRVDDGYRNGFHIPDELTSKQDTSSSKNWHPQFLKILVRQYDRVQRAPSWRQWIRFLINLTAIYLPRPRLDCKRYFSFFLRRNRLHADGFFSFCQPGRADACRQPFSWAGGTPAVPVFLMRGAQNE